MIRSTITATPDSESRFSERSFRRFEADLLELCRFYPKTVTIKPTTMNPETYRARVKDSMRAFVNSNWSSPVEKSKISFIIHNCIIVVRNGLIIIGPSGQTDLKSPDSSVNSLDEIDIPKIEINALDPFELQAIVLLAERGRIPIEVELKGLTPENARILELKHPNISIGERDDKFFLI